MLPPARGFLLVAAVLAMPGLLLVVTDLAMQLGLVPPPANAHAQK